MFLRVRTIFRLAPYLVTTAFACLTVLAAWALIDLLVSPDDTLVIQVVPLTDAGQVRVQVDGAVGQPGVYLLPEGSTRADAIEAAGGYLDEATSGDASDESLVADGDVILIAGVSETAAPAGPIDINAATAAELEALPGIGPVLAGRIVSYRQEHGPFTGPLDLVAVNGISERMVNELQGLITTGAQ